MKGKTVLAIIGYGYMGKIYHTACRELIQQKKRETNYKAGVNRLLDKLSLKAIVDPLVKIGYRGGIWYFNDIGHMLARRIEMGINAAIIATPIPTHYDIARQCINAYLHLLIEKPVCPSFSQVRSLSRLSRAKGVKILPGHVERYNPVTVEAREALKYRMWGKPVQYNLIRVSPRPERVKESLIIDKLIHDLDLVEYLFGSYRIKKVSLVKKKKEIMQCRLTTLHPDGLHGEIFSSWTSPVKERKVFIK
ncbi:Gfo/Idh/MocA family oxidoreductase, partial [bacterium]|nr:Gfo/Idh/MocA family oxidoreductase [bacterium]